MDASRQLNPAVAGNGLRLAIGASFVPPYAAPSPAIQLVISYETPNERNMTDPTNNRNGPTNAKRARGGSCRKKPALTTDSRAALSNGMKIYMDSLNAYSLKNKTASKSSAKRATKPRPKLSAKDVTDYDFNAIEKVNLNMKLETPNPLLKIPSILGSRLISISSLRPGDWLRIWGLTTTQHWDCRIVQNSELLQKVELQWPDGDMLVVEYANVANLGDAVLYLGRGHRRLWLKYLPRFMRQWFNPYSNPA